MRKLLLCVWLLLPVAAGAYHLGPGQDQLREDEAARSIRQAAGHVARAGVLAETEGELSAASEWALAERAYADALGLLPEARVQQRQRLRLERAKCQMFVSKLPEANAELANLVEELTSGGEPDGASELLADARSTYANSQYYMTWLMRLEGAPREDWEPRIESARQTFKLLAEQAQEARDTERLETTREDLESAIRLARMDLTELQGLPLPSQ